MYLSFYIFTAEIIMFEGLTCVYRSNVDLFFYVVGSSQENEVKYSLLIFSLGRSYPDKCIFIFFHKNTT